MSERRPDADERDERGTRPPADDEPETTEEGEPSATESPGPRGNPEVDEEALRHRQQETDD
jgi:hypothetical protein